MAFLLLFLRYPSQLLGLLCEKERERGVEVTVLYHGLHASLSMDL